jgi:uncharacterized protein (TIGR03382 family)
MKYALLLLPLAAMLTSPAALAQPNPAPRPSADERYLPGPGGGEPPDAGDPNDRVESTGLESGPGGACHCRLARDEPGGGPAFGAASLLGLAWLCRRRRRAGCVKSIDPRS